MSEMTKKEAKERIEHLKQVIDKHRFLYHVLDKEEISEDALDSLKKELFDLELQFPEFVTPDSPTQRVGGKPLEKFRKVRHEVKGKLVRMNSLNDAFSEEDLRAWFERFRTYVGRDAEPNFFGDLKLDGLAIELVYRNGVLVRGATRGDGEYGEDVTQNIKTIEAIPLRFSGKEIPEEVVIRGEAVLTKKEFERINAEQKKKGGKLYANPRNVAAGSIRQLDPTITASRKLDFYAYGIAGGDSPDFYARYPTREAEYEALRQWGIKTTAMARVVPTLEAVLAFHGEVKKGRDRVPFEIDGIVVSINDNRLYDRGGVVGKAPRGAVAYKFSPREATTVVEDIIVQVGRTGTLTPVAVLRPVNVGGVTITHASLHNADEVKRLDVRIGDTVIVSRAGDVIPQITKTLTEIRAGKEREFKMPEKCPIDGSKVVREGAFYRCSNPECGARHKENLYHFVSRGGFNIEGLGPKIIDRFLDEGLITDAADIFILKEGDIAALPRFGEKSAQNIARETAMRKTVSLPRFIYSLGILHVGEETANLLAKEAVKECGAVKNPREFLECIKEFSLERLQEIPDVGPKVAESIFEWFQNKRHVGFVEKLASVGVKIEKPPAETAASRKLAGLSFVLTGTLENMSREAAKEKIRELGGDPSESVSKKTSYVVAGTEPGSKYEKAKKLGVKILSEKEFLDLLS